MLAKGLSGLHIVLFCTIVLGWIIGNSIWEFYSWLVDTWVYIFLGWQYRCLVHNQAVSSDACIIDSRWCIVLSMLVSICVGIDKQSSYTLVFMSQVKVINTYGDYRLLHHNFTQSGFGQTNEVGYSRNSPLLLLS